MPPQLCELEALLRQLVAEHRRLLAHVQKHEAAMKAFDLKAMDDAGHQQESSRLRIVMLEQRRRSLTQQLSRAAGGQGELTLRKLAILYPSRAEALTQLRQELKELLEQITARTYVTGKVASAVLGHLNTVVRLLAGVVERAGLYTKNGVPRVSARIGAMEAVG